jgi:hypothetical protein
MKNLIKKLEIIWLKYMTNVIFFMIASIWILKFFCILDIEYSLTSTWAIFAFWYWYKRYERDKELQIIKDFNLLEWDGIDFKKWMMIYNLYKKWYISS